MNYFIYASTAIFIFLALIWNNKTWPNVLLKALFLFMSVAGIILSLTALGYMVRVIK